MACLCFGIAVVLLYVGTVSSQCPVGSRNVKYYNDYCYTLSTERKTWSEAANYCRRQSTAEERGRLLSLRYSNIWTELKYWTTETLWTSGYTSNVTSSSRPVSRARWYWTNAVTRTNPDTEGNLTASLSILPYSTSNATGNCLAVSRYRWVPQPCTRLSRFVCEFGPCGADIVLNGTTKTIFSPRYPSLYPGNSDCEWFIDVGKGNAIIKFEDFNLEGGSCTYDNVKISRIKGSYTLATRCGSDLPSEITSSSRYMYVRFTTDGSDHFKGFKATIRSSADDSSRLCKLVDPLTHTVTGEHGVITSPNFPQVYGHNITVNWQISVPSGAVNLRFTDFDIQSADSAGNCSYDSLTIRVGNQEGPLLGTYCGNQTSNVNSTVGGSLYLTLKTDGTTAKTGFRAIYWSSNARIRIISEGGGEIATPSYPTAYFGKYTWYIDTLEGVAKLFLSPAKRGSYGSSYSCSTFRLEVKDGITQNSERLSLNCGSGTRSNVTSPTRYITIHVEAESSSYASRNYRVLKGTFRSSSNCSNYLQAEKGSITSPNYPSYYDPYTRCTWHIDVKSGKAILRFSTFRLQAHSNCTYDRFEVFDGNSTDSPSKGVFCGTLSTMPEITASTQYLTLRMVSDNTGRSSGFHANFWSSDVNCTMWGFADVHTMQYNGTCYGLFTSRRTWKSALQFCEARNSSMVTFESDATYNALKNWVFHDLGIGTYNFWTAGYRRVGNSSQWYWKTFQHGDVPIKPSLLHWKAGQPNGNDEYIYMRSDGLYDYGTGETNYVVCEDSSRVTALGHLTTTSCSPPPYLRNGIYFPAKSRYNTGSSITFSCDSNYHMIGNNTLTCKDGLWSGHIPVCAVITTTPPTTTTTVAPPVACLSLPAIQHGKLIPEQTTYDHGSTVNAACNSGYEIQDNQHNIVCSNGGWQGSIPYCVQKKATTTEEPRIGCEFPENTGSYSQFYPRKAKYRDEETVLLLCEYGNKPSQNHSMKCVQGHWTGSFPFPTCQKKNITTVSVDTNPPSTSSPTSTTDASAIKESRESKQEKSIESKQEKKDRSRLLGGLIPVIVILVLVIVIASIVLYLKHTRGKKSHLLLMEMEE